ncbi:hypothetical protein [Phytohabitans aurantiacus]|jgi:hypothetical protein
MTSARSPGSGETLQERQAALVEALVAGAAIPDGFDARLVEAARRALLRKRAGDVARHWPLLAASFGARWPEVFAEWAAGRPPQGGWQDGLDLARSVPLTGAAAAELASRTPRPRRWWHRRRS